MESESSIGTAMPTDPRRSANDRIVRLGVFVVLAIFGCLHFVGNPAHADNIDGSWSPVHDWPLIAIHAALTPDGRVLTYGTDGAGKQTGYFIYDIWDPAAGLAGGHLTLQNMTLTDIFCSSQVILPQSGEILISGGDNWTGTRTTNTGNNNSNLFDFGDNSLARSTNMNRARWYSSATVLVNGDVYIQGGSGGADRPEVRQSDGVFRLLSGASTSGYATLFPRNFLAPDGRVFGYDTTGKMYFVDASGSGSIAPMGQYQSSNAGWTSSAAMFRPGRILQIGGNSNGAVVIDINGPQPVVSPTQSMSSRRQWVSATVLADGQVLATGGSEVDNQMTGVNNNAEIWNPATGQWHVGVAGVPARLYHSSALLLPDATVLVAGGGAPGPQINTNAEIYTPPYLFGSDGNLAARPSIVSAPDTANVGDNLTVQVDAPISRVTLVKTGSVTHSVNMDQRFIELPFTASGNMLDVSLPVRATDTPPGFYLMFAFDGNGVPSIGSMLRINVDPTPNTAVDYTPTIGGGGGSDFTLACDSDEILVGVFGKYATYVNQIGPQCVRMDQLGRWIGDPVNGNTTGSTGSGTDFVKTCPRDHAISGFRGRAGQYLNQVEIECRALTPAGGLTGDGLFLGPAGGSGGTSQGLLRCGTDNPGYALYGRSGGWLDSFGLQCRQGAVTPISLNSEPVIVNPGPQSDIVGLPANVQLEASDGDNDPLTFAAVGLPPGLQLSASTGEITGTPNQAGDYPVQVTVSDGTDVDTANFNWTISTAAPLSVDPMPSASPAIAGAPVSYTAVSQGGVNVVYSWDFGDGTAPTAFSSSPTINHAFAEPGIRYVTLTVNDDFGVPHVQTFVQHVHLPLTTNRPAVSSSIAFEDRLIGSDRVWVVNSDNDSVTVIDVATNTKIAEISVGRSPRAIATSPDGRIWVTNQGSASISVINTIGLLVDQTITLPYASQPYGLVFSPTDNSAYVVLESIGALLKVDASTGQSLVSVSVGPEPRHLAISADGTAAYVSRFITPRQPGENTASPQSQVGGVDVGGEVVVVDTGAMSVTDTIVLAHSMIADAENQGSGVPNYVGPVTISPDGTTGWVPSKQDNIGRGSLRDGNNINFQNTVRSITSRIDLGSSVEDLASRIDHDNSSVASAAASDPLGIYLFVAQETSREVAVVDMHGGSELFRLDTGRAPQGVAISTTGDRLFVSNFMDRTVDVYDLTALLVDGQWQVDRVTTIATVENEALSQQVLRGKQFFYDARDTRLARDRYLSCASCHNNGSGDGRVWDLTGMGEGLRNTISLNGTGADNGRLHWSQNFDEVQDFEGQIRDLSEGTGLMADADFFAGTRHEPLGDIKAGVSTDLDALAAYVSSLDEFELSPFRNSDGSLTVGGAAGRDIFRRENCAACHSGVDFTDSSTDTLHDIGTLKPSSGSRLNGPLTGIDTPTLRGIWETAPYLHDGSAATLADAIVAHDFVSIGSSDLASLSEYLRQIDANEIEAPVPNSPPEITNPGAQASETGTAISLAIAASDSDGDVLTYSAIGLPTGLSINSASGLIAGTPTAAGNFTATVTVDDGEDSVSASFAWSVTVPNTPPVITNPGAQASETGTSINLAIAASDADGDTLTYAASGLPTGLSINSASGLISGTPTAAGNFIATVTVDDGEDSVSTSFAWTVNVPNTPPVISNPGAQASETGTAINLAIAASDADGDTLTYAASGLPTGLTINSASGLISGTPTVADGYLVTVTVDDGEDSVSASFAWTVTLPNTPPVISNPGAQASETGTAINLSIVASDADGDTLTYAASGLPTGLTINSASGLISGTPTVADGYTVTVTVDDGEDSVSASFAWTVTVPNTPPVITNPGAQTSETGTTVSLAIIASDADGETLTYAASGLPTGLSINSASGLISGTPTAAGNFIATVTVDDGEDSVSTSFAWTVNVPNTPPVISNPGAQASETGSSVNLAIVASDADGDTLTYAASALPTGLSINSASGLISGTPTAAGNFIATVTVDDGEDSANTSFAWTVSVPNTPPVITNPGPQASETGTAINLAIAASDADGDTLTYAASGLPAGLTINSASGLISGTPTAAGNFTATVTVDDGEDSVRASFAWTVTVPNTPPVISNPGAQASETGTAISLAIAASDSDGDVLTYSAIGLPTGLSINSASGLIGGSPTAAGNYTATVTVDDGEDSVSASFAWTVTVPNTPPVITNPGAQASETGTAINLAIAASDADGDSLTYAASGLPTGLSINSASGLISGTPTAAGDHTATVTVDDGEDSVSTSFAWTVTVPNTPPVISNPGAQTSETGTTVSLAIIASDADGDALTYSASGLPTGLTINSSTGAITGTPTVAGAYMATATVDDGEDGVSASFAWTVTVPNTPPVITNPGAQAAERGTAINLLITASDADGDALTYSASGLPTGLTINSSTGAITGTPTVAGDHAVTITVDDGEDSASTSFAWTVTVPNTPPVITNPGAQASETGSSVNLAIAASDADGDTLTYAASGLPTGLSINSASGSISGTPTSAGNYIATVTVDDGEDSVSTNFAWTVSVPNTPPVVTNPGAQASETGTTVSLPITASDADGDTLTYGASGLPTGLSINSASGLISGTPTAVGDYAVTITVDDGEDSVSISFAWSVTVPNTPPVITNPGAQASETGTATNLSIVASDADGDALTYTASGLPVGLSINSVTGLISGTPTAAGNYTATVTVNDGEDSASTSFAWTVTVPNTPPVISNPGAQASETGTAINLAIAASDADGDTLTYAASGLPTGLTINSASGLISGTPTVADGYLVTVTVDDGEDSVSASFAWTVTLPNTPPVISNPGAQASETGTAINLAIAASDADGDTLTYAATGLPTGLSINSASGLISGTPTAAGDYAVTITVDDGEDSASTSFAWTVTVPNTPPVITNPGSQVSESGTVVNLAIAASDADGDVLTYSALELPDGLTIVATTGQISGVPTTPGNFNVSIRVDDGRDSATANFTWHITNANSPPVVTNPGPQVSHAGSALRLAIVASDVDGDILSYTAAGLPPGLSISDMTGVITGRPTTVGTYTVSVAVYDGKTSASTSFQWVVSQQNAPPVIANPGPQQSEVGDAVELTLVSQDPDGDRLWFSAIGLPPGLAIDAATGTVSGTPVSTGKYTVTASVSDAYYAVSISFEWSIEPRNSPPTLSNPGSQQSLTGTWIAMEMVASDGDGDTLAFSATGLPMGLTIDPESGMISGTPEQEQFTAVTVTVTDGRLRASENFEWTVSNPEVVEDEQESTGGVGSFGYSWLLLLLLLCSRGQSWPIGFRSQGN